METISAISQLSYYVFALFAVALCVILFRHYHQSAWLLVSVAFVQPVWSLLLRIIHGRPLLHHITTTTSPDGNLITTGYRVEFPIFYIVAIIGLLLLIKKARHESAA